MHRILLFGLRPILLLLIAFPSFAASVNVYDRVHQPGLSSSTASQALLLDVVKAPDTHRLIAVGEQGTILYSDDLGEYWQQARTPVSILLTAVQMVSARSGWAIGHDGVILHTRDGGLSWQVQMAGSELVQRQQDALQKAIEIARGRGNTALEDALGWQLEDVQSSLEEGAMPTLLDLHFMDEQRGIVIGAYGVMFHTEDGGLSWYSLGHRLPNPDGLHLNSVLLNQAGRLLVAGEAGLIIYSDDLGEHWQSAESPYEGSFFALAESNRLYLLGLRGHLFSSVDGVDWIAEPVPTRTTLNAAVTGAGQLYLLGQGGLVMQRQAVGFVPLSSAARQSYAAGIRVHDQLILAGEGGISTVSLIERGGAQ